MSTETIKVPDIGGAEGVDVIEICVNPGDVVAEEESLIVLETDKATMDIPAPKAGKIVSINLQVGSQVSEGDDILVMEMEGGAAEAPAAPEPAPAAAPPEQQPAQVAAPVAPSTPVAGGGIEDIVVPDIGGAEGVEVIEVAVAAGDSVAEEDTLIVLETDKATMDIPAPKSGTVKEMAIKVGDKVSQGDFIGKIEAEGGADASAASTAPAPAQSAPAASAPASSTPAASQQSSAPTAAKPQPAGAGGTVHAGPAVRKLARELGVDLTKVTPTGPRNRIQKDDLHNFVKEKMKAPQGGAGGLQVADMPTIDFSKFGEVEYKDLNKIKRATAKNLHRSWVTVPHVTQFDEADITELEKFRKNEAKLLAPEGVKVSPLAFIIKAVAAALVKFPQFNSSLNADGSQLILKKYVNIGVAVETPDGLVVPVIKDVDKKGIFELAAETAAIAKKARDKKLPLDAMQGGCFSVSSLGGIGGTSFTPIVNAPEVAILGVSKSEMKPKWNGSDFEPRLTLPLSLSYDHRVIDGAEAARFTTYLSTLLGDLRTLLL